MLFELREAKLLVLTIEEEEPASVTLKPRLVPTLIVWLWWEEDEVSASVIIFKSLPELIARLWFALREEEMMFVSFPEFITMLFAFMPEAAWEVLYLHYR